MRNPKLQIHLCLLVAFGMLLLSSVGQASSRQCVDLMAGKSAPVKPVQPAAPRKAKPISDGYILKAADLKAANLLDPENPTKKKVDAYERSLMQEKIGLINHVEWVEKTLKAKYQGWDDQITQMMASIKNLVLNNESNDRLGSPIVIPLMTFPGYGKSSVVLDLVTLLAKHKKLKYLENVFENVPIKKNSGWLSMEGMRKAGTLEVDPNRPISQIVFYDEIQNLLSLEELQKIKLMDDAEKDVALSQIQQAMGFAKKPTIDYVITNRQEMINSMWSIFGNGRAPRPAGIGSENFAKRWTEAFTTFNMSERIKFYNQVKIESKEASIKSDEARVFMEASKADAAAHPENAELVKSAEEALIHFRTLEKARDVAVKKLAAEDAKQTNHYANPAGFDAALALQLPLIQQEYPRLLAEMNFKSLDEFKAFLYEDPDAASNLLVEKLAMAPKDIYQDYRRMIVFIAGNPTPVLDDILHRAQVDPSTLDPDALNRLAKSTSRRITLKFFEGIFGKTEAMKSRMKINSWDLVPPFTTNQWQKFIRNRLEQTHTTVLETLRKVTYPTGMDLEIYLDSSLGDFLTKNAISTAGGPRVFNKNAEGYLSIIETNLPLLMKNFPKEHRIWKSNQFEVVREIAAGEKLPKSEDPNYEFRKIHLRGKDLLVKKWHKFELTIYYQSSTNSFVAAEIPKEPLKGRYVWIGKDSDNVRLILENEFFHVKDPVTMQLPLGEKIEKPKNEPAKNSPSLSRVRGAFFQAARAVVAMQTFHSVPNVIADSNTTADHALPEMWHITNTEHLDYWMVEAKTLLAGLVIEKIQPDLMRNKQSDLTKTELILLATNVLDKIASELASRDKYTSYLRDIDNEPTDVSDLIPKDLAENPIFEYAFGLDQQDGIDKDDAFAAIKTPMKRKILRYIYKDVEHTLTTHMSAVNAIAAHMIEKGPVESETVSAIVANYFTAKPKVWNFWRAPVGTDIKNRILSGQAGAALEVQTPGMGSFNYEVEKLSLWGKLKSMFRADRD